MSVVSSWPARVFDADIFVSGRVRIGVHPTVRFLVGGGRVHNSSDLELLKGCGGYEDPAVTFY